MIVLFLNIITLSQFGDHLKKATDMIHDLTYL